MNSLISFAGVVFIDVTCVFYVFTSEVFDKIFMLFHQKFVEIFDKNGFFLEESALNANFICHSIGISAVYRVTKRLMIAIDACELSIFDVIHSICKIKWEAID